MWRAATGGLACHFSALDLTFLSIKWEESNLRMFLKDGTSIFFSKSKYFDKVLRETNYCFCFIFFIFKSQALMNYLRMCGLHKFCGILCGGRRNPEKNHLVPHSFLILTILTIN